MRKTGQMRGIVIVSFMTLLSAATVGLPSGKFTGASGHATKGTVTTGKGDL